MSLLPGMIIKGVGGFYYIKTDNTIYECKARGIFRKEATTPLTGDLVKISVIDESSRKGCIEEILPRSSLFPRPAVANTNQLAAVIATISPEPDLVLLDKLLITAEAKDMKSIIIISKIDLDAEKKYVELIEAYKKATGGIIPVSSITGEGFDSLRNALYGKITVFAGQSGVGKSTILNKIMNEFVMQTGEISIKIQRGKHTTRHAELVQLDGGGYVVDTPGFSSFELTDIEPGELWLHYPEFYNMELQCRFSHCSHISEPDCAIKASLQRKEADNGRYQRYIKIYNIIKKNKERKVRDT